MSYINVSFTHRTTTPALTQRLDLGFSREGGRLEGIERTIDTGSGLQPVRYTVDATPRVTEAANAVRDAIQAGSWVQDVELVDGHGRVPGEVTWTYRHGGGGTAPTNALPTQVQAVVDAALALERLAAPTATILPA